MGKEAPIADEQSRIGAAVPPLKWVGGKRRLVPYLRRVWESLPAPKPRLVEPFCGGLAVALGLGPEHALLNDANPHLINFYQWIARGRMSLAGIPTQNTERVYYRNRARFNELARTSRGRQTREAAALFYYLNRTGFNGVCRFNVDGEFNVPYGRYRAPTLRSEWRDLAERLAGYRFTTGDFELVPLEPTDFVYADPPYDVEFTSYSKGGFRWENQVRVAHWLAEHPGPVVASNQATPRVKRLYRDLGFTLRFLDARRSVSCNGDRTPAREMLAFRNLTPPPLPRNLMEVSV